MDYGNSCEMPVEELRELPSQLLEVPFQVNSHYTYNLKQTTISNFAPFSKITNEA